MSMSKRARQLRLEYRLALERIKLARYELRAHEALGDGEEDGMAAILRDRIDTAEAILNDLIGELEPKDGYEHLS